MLATLAMLIGVILYLAKRYIKGIVLNKEPFKAL
jgi:hypothetical protein